MGGTEPVSLFTPQAACVVMAQVRATCCPSSTRCLSGGDTVARAWPWPCCRTSARRSGGTRRWASAGRFLLPCTKVTAPASGGRIRVPVMGHTRAFQVVQRRAGPRSPECAFALKFAVHHLEAAGSPGREEGSRWRARSPPPAKPLSSFLLQFSPCLVPSAAPSGLPSGIAGPRGGASPRACGSLRCHPCLPLAEKDI